MIKNVYLTFKNISLEGCNGTTILPTVVKKMRQKDREFEAKLGKGVGTDRDREEEEGEEKDISIHPHSSSY